MPPTVSSTEFVSAQPSARKLAALRQLQQLSLKLSDGYDYQLHEAILPDITLGQVREELAVIQEPLSSTVVKERERP